MKAPVNLLVVYGDGPRVVRLGLPRWVVYGAVGLAAVAGGTLIGLSSAYLRVERERSELIALRQRVGQQRRLIAAVRERVATVRGDITAWRALHADMWEALGSKGGSAEQATGVGGALGPVVPEGPAAAPRPLEELNRLVSSVAEESPRLRQLTGLIGRMGKMLNALPLRWPVRGPVNSEYGERRSPWNGRRERHGGIDIGASRGTPVKSPAAGTVIVASAGGGFGKHVKLDHGNGVRSLYGHLSKLDVRAGQRVEKDQVIGLVGSTGRSTGPHLHYEVRVEGERVDPRAFLWER
jgi:murein DD-endopeptidase MepM/ murein hydrolase activator NlpD